MGAPLSECYQSPELASKMPGHDHSLRKLYTIEGLSNPSMVYNWVCPMMPKEGCPYEALAHIFNKYFTDTNVDTVDMVEGVSNVFLHYTRFLGFPEFSGYHQWQQESQ